MYSGTNIKGKNKGDVWEQDRAVSKAQKKIKTAVVFGVVTAIDSQGKGSCDVYLQERTGASSEMSSDDIPV